MLEVAYFCTEIIQVFGINLFVLIIIINKLIIEREIKKYLIHISNQVNLVKKLSVEAFNKVHIVLNEIGTFYISVGRLRDFSKLVDKGYYFAFRPKVFQQNLTTI